MIMSGPVIGGVNGSCVFLNNKIGYAYNKENKETLLLLKTRYQKYFPSSEIKIKQKHNQMLFDILGIVNGKDCNKTS